ncbi:MAG: hypothetical protein M1835_007706 [Candelina submexicana]|nr:MAG: hypothetical protein M1835_007706 [Candelina submexicana]
MGKTPQLKKHSKSTSIRSRSAKRASSPSLNLDKSLKSAKPPPSSSNYRPSVLSAHHDGGISKKSKKAKPISRQRRLRQEKGIERAEAVMGKTEKKVIKSIGKQRVIKSRRAAWDEHNERIVASKEVEDLDKGSKLQSSAQKSASDTDSSMTPEREPVANVTAPTEIDEDEIL